MEQKQGQRQNVDGQPKSLVLDFLPCEPGLVISPKDDNGAVHAVYQHIQVIRQVEGPRKKGGGNRYDNQDLSDTVARDEPMILFHNQPSCVGKNFPQSCGGLWKFFNVQW